MEEERGEEMSVDERRGVGEERSEGERGKRMVVGTSSQDECHERTWSREPILTERVRSSEQGPTTLKMAISVLGVDAYCYGKYPRYLSITGTEKWPTHSNHKISGLPAKDVD